MPMKITGYGPITTPGRATRPGAAQGRFRLPGNGAAGAASEARDAGAAEGVSIAASLIALQETMLAAERDREARARADRMLEELAELQRGILGGRLSAARLRELAALADQPGVAADGRLAEIVGAITLRARVELARLELAAAGGVANGG
jgi:hypothetical protein